MKAQILQFLNIDPRDLLYAYKVLDQMLFKECLFLNRRFTGLLMTNKGKSSLTPKHNVIHIGMVYYIGELFRDIRDGPITLSGAGLDITRQELEHATRLTNK